MMPEDIPHEFELANKPTFVITGALYDRLKFLQMILLPAFGTLYFTLGAIWGLPGGEKVVATTTALTLFLGLVLKVSNAAYDASGAKYGGHISVLESPTGALTYTLEMDTDPETLKDAGEITFRVGNVQKP